METPPQAKTVRRAARKKARQGHTELAKSLTDRHRLMMAAAKMKRDTPGLNYEFIPDGRNSRVNPNGGGGYTIESPSMRTPVAMHEMGHARTMSPKQMHALQVAGKNVVDPADHPAFTKRIVASERMANRSAESYIPKDLRPRYYRQMGNAIDSYIDIAGISGRTPEQTARLQEILMQVNRPTQPVMLERATQQFRPVDKSLRKIYGHRAREIQIASHPSMTRSSAPIWRKLMGQEISQLNSRDAAILRQEMFNHIKRTRQLMGPAAGLGVIDTVRDVLRDIPKPLTRSQKMLRFAKRLIRR